MSKATPASASRYMPLSDEQNGTATSTSPSQYAKLPSILRDCAVFVERNEFHPVVYQALALLHQYARDNAGSNKAAAPGTSTANSVDGSEVVAAEIPEDRSGSPTPTTASANSGGFVPVKKFSQFSKNIGSAFKGTEKVLDEALSKLHIRNKSAAATDEIQDTGSADWCDEHFIRGCMCKGKIHQEVPVPASTAIASEITQPRPQSSLSSAPPSNAPLPSTPGVVSSFAPATPSNKPCFQRPINPKSNLIANGWIEQQRRSKMRVIWKDILASLVEGRKAKEETTLWIQRQVTNPATGKQELEALHQIPMKWIEDVQYVDMYGDHRFSIKIFNVLEEFQFRVRDADSAHNWVVTLLSAVEASNKGIMMTNVTAPPLVGTTDTSSTSRKEDVSAPPTLPIAPDGRETKVVEDAKVSTIKELRAIAENAGIDTRGMERSELERIAVKCQQSSSFGEQKEPTIAPRNTNPFESGRFQSIEQQQIFAAATRQFSEDEQRKRQLEEQQGRLRQQQLEEQERIRQQQLEEQERRRRQQEEQDRIRQQQLEEQERRRRLQEEQERIRKQQLEEQERRRRLQEEQERRRQLEEQERKRQLAEEEYRRRQQQEELERRRQAEEQERKRQSEEQERKRQLAEEEYRRRMAWQQQQQQQNFFQQQQSNGSAPPPSQKSAPPPSAGAVNEKYAHIMEQRSEENEQAAITAIKRNILINWALSPPRYNTLRPIDQLVLSIHTCFPPAFGVKEHEFFQKWKPILPNELVMSAAMGNTPNVEKLKKAVRKIRFFLHPDKRPKDLNSDQEFMCKMLWDITSDAWDEFCSKNEELDWLRS